MLGELGGELVKSFVPRMQVRVVQILVQLVTVELLYVSEKLASCPGQTVVMIV